MSTLLVAYLLIRNDYEVFGILVLLKLVSMGLLKGLNNTLHFLRTHSTGNNPEEFGRIVQKEED